MVPFLQPNLTKKLQKLFNYPPLCTSQQQLSVKEADVVPTKASSASDDLTAAPSQEKPKLHSPRSAYTHGNPSGLSLYTVQACRCARDGAAMEKSFCKPCYRALGEETLVSVQLAGCKEKQLLKNRARRGPRGSTNTVTWPAAHGSKTALECLLTLLHPINRDW